MRQAMQTEKEQMLEWLIRSLSDPAKKDAASRVLRDLAESDDANLKSLRDVSREQVLEGAIALRPVYDKVVAMMDAPPAEMKDPESVLAGLSPAARSLGMGLLPAAMKCRTREIVYQTRLAMLKAAFAAVRGGAEELKAEALRDPHADGAFLFEKTDGGFRLVSKTLESDGKPVTMVVGPEVSK